MLPKTVQVIPLGWRGISKAVTSFSGGAGSCGWCSSGATSSTTLPGGNEGASGAVGASMQGAGRQGGGGTIGRADAAAGGESITSGGEGSNAMAANAVSERQAP